MSREHAALSFGEDELVSASMYIYAQYTTTYTIQSIMIKDVQSMHGTTVNGTKLISHVPLRLQKGDCLEFGANVRRGPEEFPAVQFEIDWEISPWRSAIPCPYLSIIEIKSNSHLHSPESSGFQVPDGSDDEDVDYTDKESNQNEDLHEIESTPIESPVAEVAARPKTIDLTGDESEDMDIYSVPKDSSVEEVFPERTQRQSPFNYESDSDNDDGSVSEAEEDGIEVQRRTDAVLQSILDDFDSDEENMDEIEYGSEDEELSDEGSDKENDFDDGSSAFYNDSLADSELKVPESPVVVADGSVQSRQMASNAESITQDHLTRGPAISGFETNSRELIHIMGMEDPIQLPPFQHNKDIPESYIRTPTKTSPADVIMFSGNEETQPVLALDRHDMCYNSQYMSWVDRPAESLARTDNVLKTASGVPTPHGTAAERQPSPSDAAMVKPVSVSPTNLMISANKNAVRPIDTQLPTSDWQQFMATNPQKREFFQAREENRTASQAISRPRLESPTSDFWSRGAPIIPTPSMRLTTAQFRTSLPPVTMPEQTKRPVALPTQTGLASAVRPDDKPFVDLSGSMSEIRRQPSPELDMTSAFLFNQSKTSGGNEIVPTEKIAVKERPIARAKKSLKRKADDISDVLEEELHVWGNSPPRESTSATGSRQLPTSSQEGPKANNNDAVVNDSEVLTNTNSQEPPTKRLKKFAEKLGYAALGGLAVGTGLFSVLVATAPDFI
jgi:hypothetical protein